MVAIVLWGLPQLGINIPLIGLIALMAALAVYSVVTYRIGSRALKKKPVSGLSEMVGSRGVVVTPLDPQGQVRIKNELWEAEAITGSIDKEAEVIVLKREGLKLVVRRAKESDYSRRPRR